MSLDFYVWNKPVQMQDPSGLRVEMISFDTTTIITDLPEPATWAFIGLGLTGMLAFRRKR